MFNLFTIRRLRDASAITGSVAVLIPMRDEEHNALDCVNSALAQTGIEELRVFALDDGSSDATAAILNSINDPRFQSKFGNDLPAGWLGKNFALHTLATDTTADYLVFLDADVRLTPDAIVRSINLMAELDLDYLCPYPQQIALSWLERLVQPLLQWSWFASLPLVMAERSLRPSTVVANGQLFIVRAAAYESCGGHEAIKGEVLDDMELARVLRATGFRGTVVDGSDVASCRMYQSSAELTGGYLKSQWRAFGGWFGALVAINLMFWSSIAPIALAVSGWTLGWYCYLVVVTTRMLVALRTKSSIVSPWFHPIAISFWIFLILASLWRRRTNQLMWRGRAI